MLFTALVRAAEQQLREFHAQNLANMAWTFATVSLLDERLFGRLAIDTAWPVSESNPQELANMAWAFARVNLVDEKLFRALERGGAEDERVHCTTSRQHRMSVCQFEQVGREAVHSVRESGGPAGERDQSAGSR